MANYNTLANKYFIKREEDAEWVDITRMFDGIKVLAISGFNERGEAQNVYTAQWVTSQEADYFLSGEKVVRSNVELSMTFIAGTRYSSGGVDTEAAYNAFVNYICDEGDFYIMSAYSGKQAHVVCQKGVKPTTEKLHRGSASYILATATLQTLDATK